MSDSNLLNLTIKTVSNTIYHVSTPTTATIIDLKNQIRTETAVEIDRQRLIYRGRVLQDETRLQDYNIEDGHTVHLVVRPENIPPSVPTSTGTGTTASVPASASATRTSPTIQRIRVVAPPSENPINGEELNTMEHIRQNLLTMHTLVSTVEAPELINVLHQHDLGYSNHNTTAHSSTLEQMDFSHEDSNANISRARDRKFFVGQWIDVKDTVAQWLEATVMDINEIEKTLFVHYNGWPERWDEWISSDSPRIAPFRSRTVHSSMTSYQSPTPNVSLARAPITGANDLRTLLPEVARMFRVLQPIIENAAHLAEESLQDRPTVSAYRPNTSPSDSATTSANLAEQSNEERTGIRRRTTTASSSSAAGSAESNAAAAASASSTLRVAPGMPWANVGLAPVPTLPSHSASQEKADASQGEAISANMTERRLRQRQGEISTDSSPSSMMPSSMAIFPLSNAPVNVNMEVDEPIQNMGPGSDSMNVHQYMTNGSSDTGYSSVSSTRKRPVPATQYDTDDLPNNHPATLSNSEESADRKPSAQDDTTSSLLDQSSSSRGVMLQDSEGASGNGAEVTESTRQQREERVLARDARLRCVVQELCPLIDRFGRVLTDLAPHLWEMGALDASLGQESTAEQQQQTPANFEASLLSLLRNRPPSPQPRRAYRTPISLQTRGIASTAGLALVPGIGLMQRNGSGGGVGVANAANAGNVVASILNDLAMLGGGPGTAGVSGSQQPPAPRSQTGITTSAGALTQGRPGGPGSRGPVPPSNRHLDIHIAFLQQPQLSGSGNTATNTTTTSSASLTEAQGGASSVAHRIAQAELAENIRARTELLSNQTQELNTYSLAIEEMLRSLNAEIAGSGSGAQIAVSSTAQPTSNTTTASTGSSSTTNNISTGNNQVSVATTATSTRLPRVYASSILPGPLSSLLTSPNPTASPTITTAPATAQSGTSTASSVNAEAQLGDDIVGALRTLQAGREDITRLQEHMQSSDDITRDVQQQQQEESGGAESDEGEGEEVEEPLNDLLPTLSFNELGQSLMDLRSLHRQNHTIADVAMNRSSFSPHIDTTTTLDTSTTTIDEAPVAPIVVEQGITHEGNLPAAGPEGTEEEGVAVVNSNPAVAEASPSVQEQLPAPQQQPAQAPTSMFERLRRFGEMMHNLELDVSVDHGTARLNYEPKSTTMRSAQNQFSTDDQFLFGFERQPGLKESNTAGFYGDNTRHILTYDPSSVRSVLVPFTDKDITVCNSTAIWLHHLAFLVYALLLMFFLAYTSFGDGAMGGGSACSDDNTNQNLDVCKLDEVLTDAKSDFRWLIAFVLAGYVGISVTQWAVRRQNYASLCGNARNLNILIASFLPVDPENSDIMLTRRTMGRWVMLAYELAVLKARGHMDSEEGKSHLIALGLLDETDPHGEWDAMVAGDRHSTIFWWLQLRLVDLDRQDILKPHHLQILCMSVSKMRAMANDLMSSLDRDKPFPYTALCGLLVYINILIMSTWKGVTWSIWYYSYGPDLFRQPRIWVDMLVLLFWNISYAALYDLGYMLHNPFGRRRIDVAHETIGSGIRTLSSSLAAAVAHIPMSLRRTMMHSSNSSPCNGSKVQKV